MLGDYNKFQKQSASTSQYLASRNAKIAHTVRKKARPVANSRAATFGFRGNNNAGLKEKAAIYVDWIALEAREFEVEQEKRRAAKAAAARKLEAEKRDAAAAADLARHVHAVCEATHLKHQARQLAA